jgi:hemoglobin
LPRSIKTIFRENRDVSARLLSRLGSGSPPGFKYLVTEMVGMATGGPQKYTGRSMADSHRDMNITPKEWDAFMDDFQQTLDKFKVPAAEQAELKAIVNSTYDDIVVTASSNT